MKLQRQKLFSLSCVHASFDDENTLHISIPISYKGFTGSKTLSLTISESLVCHFEAKAGYLISEKVDIQLEQIIRYSRYCKNAKKRLEDLWYSVTGVPLTDFSQRNCDYIGLLFACINRPSLTQFSKDPTTLIVLYDLQLSRPDQLKNVIKLKRTDIIRDALLTWINEKNEEVPLPFTITTIRKSQYRFIQKLQFENVRYGRNPYAFDNSIIVDLLAILLHPRLNTVLNNVRMIDVGNLPALSNYFQLPNIHLISLDVPDMVEIGHKSKWSHLIEDIDRMLVDINVSPKHRLKDIKELADIKLVHDKLVAELNRINAAQRLFNGNIAMMDIPFPEPPTKNTEEIQWLSTPSDLINEGSKMSHCIGNSYYCEKAHNADRAYYHIQVKNEHATLELCLRSFSILQLQGVRNTSPSIALSKKVNSWLKNQV